MGKLRVLCGTWNVNAKTCDKDVDLSKWLCRSPSAPDIVGISCQEIVPLSDVSHYGLKSHDLLEAWAKGFVKTLDSHEPYHGVEYKVLGVSQLVGIMTCVLVRTEHLPRISKVMIGYCAVGAFRVLGNKGAIGIRFRLNVGSHKYKTLCFIGSHFAAHRREVARRNEDYATIMETMNFQPVDEELSGPFISKIAKPVEHIILGRNHHQPLHRKKAGSTSTIGSEEEEEDEEEDYTKQNELLAISFGKELDLRIEDHDIIFWLGDLNYRVDTLTWREALGYIKDKQLFRLLDHDQLIAERQQNRVFPGFQEGVINFVPTYKFRPGTNEYDIHQGDHSKKKVRVPAWCDRILWRCKGTNQMLQQCSYFSCPELCMSDHKPVGAEFVLPFVELLSSPASPPTSPMSRGSMRSIDTESTRRRSSNGSNMSRVLLEHQSVVATKDFQAMSIEELSLQEGDLIEVLRDEKIKIDDGWLLGRKIADGKTGYFPSNVVKALGTVTRKGSPVPDDAPWKASAVRYHNKKQEFLQKQQHRANSTTFLNRIQSLVRKQAGFKTRKTWSMRYLGDNASYDSMVAKEDYVAQDSDELSFKKGDVVKVVSLIPSSDTETGWWMGSLNGEQGLVPRKLFEPLHSKSSLQENDIEEADDDEDKLL